MDATDAVRQNIRRLRTERDFTAAQLGERLTRVGVPWDRFTVRAAESGKRQDITIRELFALADVFGRSTEELLWLPDDCRRCHGRVPFGFTCNTCGEIGSVRD